MPGFSQLKKLSEQVLKLGNEINVRAARGEKAMPFPVPESIPDVDDSEDFVTGMPEKPKTPEQIAQEEAEAAAKAEAERKASGDDDIFGGAGFGASLGDMPDLSAFESSSSDEKKKNSVPSAMSFLEEEEEPEPEPEKPKGIDGSGYSGFGFDDDGNLEDASSFGGNEKSAEAEFAGIPELDELLNSGDTDSVPSEQKSAPPSENASSAENISAADDLFDLGDLGDLDAFESPAENSASNENEVLENSSDENQGAPEASEESDPTPAEESALFDSLPDFEQGDALSFDGQNLDDNAAPENALSSEAQSADSENADSTSDSNDGFDLGDFDDLGDFSSQEDSAQNESEISENPSEENQGAPAASEERPDAPAEKAASDDGFDLSDLGIDGIEIEDYSPASSTADSAEINVNSILGDEVASVDSEDELPEKKGGKKAAQKIPFKPKEIADDIAILKPDIFTENPVTSTNPPYYVTGEFGKLPKTEEDLAEEAAAQEAVQEDSQAEYVPQDDEGGSGFGDIDFDAMENENAGEAQGGVSAEIPSAADDASFEAEDFVPSAPENSVGEDSGLGFDVSEYDAPASSDSDDIFSADFDIGSFGQDSGNSVGGENADIDTSGGIPDFGDLGGVTDFSGGDSPLSDFNPPETGSNLNAADGDFELDMNDDFTIPGFSETDADPYAKKPPKGGLDNVDFSGAMPDPRHRTGLTPEEYKKFKKNLSEYPLNVRIAVEDMIVKNEFKDEVVFELIDKILNKVSARQLAGYLEKILDITLHVPRDFEKRTAEEYAAYKASFKYQLKAKILPAALIGLLAAMILFCVGYLGHQYIVQPLWAEKLYKEGYSLLESDNYPQSEMVFDEALTHKPKKKWFYKYAQGYRAHRQYDRAEKFYKAILQRFDHDKQAGLEYADMQLSDLGDYARAEEILKREVLDYHVNDPDGILTLGDTYLEWATEENPAKFQDAFDQYSLAMRLYGAKNADVYQSRFLRYNIRTDQLHNVLELKEFFYPREKSLGADDWVEMSGYLMDKLFGELPREQEYLRDKIEDLRDMMLFAIRADPQNPIASYNFSRYLVEVGDHSKALDSLKNTERLFNDSASLKNRDVYKQLNNYRLLGEEYLYDREYILAREALTEGINLFEKRQRARKFDGDKNVGAMYADMGNLEYFISGDLDGARRNYNAAIQNYMDTPSIRYRVGYIDYSNNDYASALGNFLKASEDGEIDSHTLLALGNTLSLRGDNFTAQSYYGRLLSYLDFQREKYGIVVPQIEASAGDMVETYMKGANNLGVSQFRVSRQSGNSPLNAAALVNFQDSIRYYDALTRNQETMVRLPGSNLAEQNLRYATNPFPDFEPAIYTEIPRILDGEKGLEQ
ncbi:MAG: hypothetical protein HDR33_03520 [Treponema sp.]|nr:hypothetical protein [Treponema sp.]